MSDQDENLDDLDLELELQKGPPGFEATRRSYIEDALAAQEPERELASSAAPLSLEEYLAKSGRIPTPSVTPAIPPRIAPRAISAASKLATAETPAENNPQGVDRAPAVIGGMPAVAPPVSVKDYIGSRLSDKGGALKDAQREAGRNRGIANITEGLGQITAGAVGANNFNAAAYKGLHDDANQPIEDAQAQAKAKLGELQELDAEGNYNRAAALRDPDSTQSTIARNVAQRELQKYGADPKMVDGMSAADVKEFMDKTLARMDNNASREQIAKHHREDLALRRKTLDNQQNESRLIRSTNNANRRVDGNTTIKTGFNRIDKATNAEHVIAAIESGDIKDSESISQQLTSMITNIELGGGGGVSDREHTAIKSLQGSVANMKAYVTGNPGGTIPAPMLEQVKREIQVLKRGTLENVDKARKSLVAGTQVPAERDAINGRIDSYLEEHGYDPSAKHEAPAGGGWTDAKEKRLQELRAKLGK
jgi:hypothetical protein